MRSKKVTYVKAVQDELVIQPVSQLTKIRKLGIAFVILVVATIIFFNLNATYGWIDFPAF